MNLTVISKSLQHIKWKKKMVGKPLGRPRRRWESFKWILGLHEGE
jgi:hypothetical protein